MNWLINQIIFDTYVRVIGKVGAELSDFLYILQQNSLQYEDTLQSFSFKS